MIDSLIVLTILLFLFLYNKNNIYNKIEIYTKNQIHEYNELKNISNIAINIKKELQIKENKIKLKRDNHKKLILELEEYHSKIKIKNHQIIAEKVKFQIITFGIKEKNKIIFEIGSAFIKNNYLEIIKNLEKYIK